MLADVVTKSSGNAANIDSSTINLESPSVVRLKIAPESVQAFERNGNDLQLVLRDGRVVTIQNFFILDEQGNRSDLVLQDDAGVDWWGQYTSPWGEFHFAEIEEDVAAALPWWPALLGLLGAGGIAAAAGGGGSSSSRPDRAPEINMPIEAQDALDSQSNVNLDVKKYFSNPGGEPLTYSAIGLPKGLTIDPKTGIISGTIDSSGSQGGDDGTYTVTVTATTPSGKSTSQTFPWTVGNPPPVANDDTVTVDEDTVLTGNVLTDSTNGHQPDNDPDGDPLKVVSFEVEGKTYQPGETATITGGTITLHPDGSYTFTPDADWNGDVPPIEYTISDGEGGTDTAILKITVTPVDDAENDTTTTNEDEPVTIPVLENDDFDGDHPTITQVGGQPINPNETVQVDHGTVTLTPGGELVFTPDPDWNGETSFEYTVVTDKGTPETATVTVEVTPVNDPPVAEGSIGDQTNEDAETGISVDVSGNFTDVDGDDLTYSATGLPAGLSIDPSTGVISGTIDRSASQGGTDGVHAVTITATDPDGETATQEFEWTVTNPAPIANDDTVSTEEDTAISGNVLTDSTDGHQADTDPDGDDLVVTGFTVDIDGDGTVESFTPGQTATIAGVGTLVLNGDGGYTFTPDADWNGTVPTVTYTIDDSEGGTDTAELNITVDPVNDVPVPVNEIDDQANEDAETGISVDVSGNFTDVDGDDLTYSATGLPEGLSIDSGTGIISGTIDRSASQGGTGGVHAVTITATDPDGESATQEFDWTVTNPDPIANDDTVSTAEDTPLSGNVLTDSTDGHQADTDPDGDDLVVTGFMVDIDGDGTVESFTPGQTATIAGVGTLVLNGDGDYTFTPDDDWNGTVPTVTYTIDDSEGGTDTAELNITVDPVNDAPVPVNEIGDQTNEDAETGISVDVSGNFTDVDGDDLTYSATGLPAGLSIDPSTGVISGTIDRSASQGGTDGVHAVTITATDPDGESATQEFDWTVTNPDPIANDDTVSTAEDTPLSGNVLTDSTDGHQADTDPDGDDLVVTGFMVDIDGDGTVESFTPGQTATIAGVGTLVLNGDGDYTFTPDDDWNGTVPTVTYTIDDSEGGTDTAELNITVTPVNDPPVIDGGDQYGTVVEAGHLDDGTVVPGTPDATGTFAATDVDGDSLTWSVSGTPDTTYGTFSVDAESGEWTYELDNTLPATQALNEGDTVNLTYTVQVSDGAGGTATREVTITITGTNDAPVAVADTNEVTESGVVVGGNEPEAGIHEATGNVLSNDTDVDEGETDTLVVSEVGFDGTAGTLGSALTGTYGSLVLNSDGTYTYTLDNTSDDTQQLAQGTTVTEEFSYTVTDVHGAISTSTLTITITGTNDQPVITSDAAAATGEVIEEGTDVVGTATATGELTASDVDEGAEQTWSIVTTEGTYGTISIDPDSGQWTYTLDNEREATQALNDGDEETETFTARVTDEHGAYAEQVITVTVFGTNDDLTGSGDQTVTLLEDGSASGTLQEYVADPDDELIVTEFKVDVDGDGNDETFTPGTNITLSDSGGNELGTLEIAENGDYTFTPEPNYGGNVPVVTYTMAESGKVGGPTVTQSLTFEITKVADAPKLEENKIVSTDEDTAVGLGLVVPVLTDEGTGTGNDDHPERLGEITLTIGGAGADGVTLLTGTKELTPVDGELTIVLSDMPGDYHITSVLNEDPTTGVYHLTKGEYEALVANPRAESGQNFTVTVSATSYEVDSSGAILPDVDGARSEQVINVDVQAVTDGATLEINGATAADLSMAEDTVFDVTSHLVAALTDADGNAGTDSDGSETYWYTVAGLPDGTVVTINGVATTISSTVTTVSSEVSTEAEPPTITIKPPLDFSGDLDDIIITLNSQDTDDDSSHTPEIISSAVTLNLHVTPVAGDVSVSDVTTAEDTAVAFLAGVTVTDTRAGTEVINSVSFVIPEDWSAVTAPTPGDGWSVSGDGTEGSPYTITFNDDSSSGTVLSQDAREAVLDGFTITPPAHSSADVTIELSIETTDTATVDGVEVENTETTQHDLEIVVTPVAEIIDPDGDGHDTDGDGTPDLTMTPGRVYGKEGKEDEWFDLGSDAAYDSLDAFDLTAEWHNQDGNEDVFARLTPTLIEGEGDETSAIGSKFKWIEDGVEVEEVFTGSPIDVPVEALASLQFMAAPNFSGKFEITVQTVTVDYDDNDESIRVEAVSGEATLENILILPVADAVTLAVNGRANGLEDTPVDLLINPTSSDPSETFNVTISDIPVGATITYGSEMFTATEGSQSYEITNFDRNTTLTVQPPEHSNEDFTLNVSAVSVDTLTVDGETHSDQSEAQSLPIRVTVKGVADKVDVTLHDVTYTEADLDSGDAFAELSDLVTLEMQDGEDGSETLTVRLTGLPEGFSPSVGTPLFTPGTPAAERTWLLTEAQFEAAYINVPENYSGEVTFQVVPVTTENDGNSRTGTETEVSFTVTPSPEATVTDSAVTVEDEITSLGFDIVHQKGDLDETLDSVRIAANYADSANFTLYLGTGEDAVELSEAVTAVDGYYVLTAEQAKTLAVKGDEHLDGELDDFNFQYRITDGHYGEESSGDAVTSDWTNGTITIEATPVTDEPNVSITAITGTDDGETVVTDADPDDTATPDTATLGAADTVTVTLNIASPDNDGSEHVVRVIIEGVPEGVTVEGADHLGSGSWLLIYEGEEGALPIGSGGYDLPVEFVVGSQAGGIESAPITMTVQVQDRGNEAEPGTLIKEDSVTWHLESTYGGEGEGENFAVIEAWEYNDTNGAEDTQLKLLDVITGVVSAASTKPNTLTITITDLPEGTAVEGMTRTTIDGVETWTASRTSEEGDSADDIQQMLEDLMESITLTLPANSNSNNSDGENFTFNASLTTSVVDGNSSDHKETEADIEVAPRTDEAEFTIGLDTTVDDAVDESDSSIPITVTVGSSVDGDHGNIVGGNLYLQIEADEAMGDGTLTVGGTEYGLTSVSGVAGIPDGDYYVISDVAMDQELALVYTPETMTHGDVTVNAWVLNQEAGDTSDESVKTSTGSGTVTVELSNDGVEIGSTEVTGDEAPRVTDMDEIRGALIRLDLSVGLNDDDSSEEIMAILLSNLPDGFLVYTGTSLAGASEAEMTNNAGGSGGLNTWVISNEDGSLPNYVGILPPAYWSGTLDDLKLIVESGETELSESRVDEKQLAPIVVNPVANGIEITPTTAFGAENTVISLNLNAAMEDMASAGETDESTESVTLEITGLGEFASFYLGDVLIHGHDAVTVVESEDTDGNTVYTISGLSQDDLDELGFKQARAALVDQDEDASGMQIKVEAWTVESGVPDAPSGSSKASITLNVFGQLGTAGDDELIWTGATINGRAGHDTVQIRYGESLSGEQLAAQLTNVEVIDLSIEGANAITDLTPDQVKKIAGTGSALTIQGTADDSLSLAEGWEWDSENDVYTGTLTGGSIVTLTVVGVPVDGEDISENTGQGFSSGTSTFSLPLAGEDDGVAAVGMYAFLFDEPDSPPALENLLDDEPASDEVFDDWLPDSLATETADTTDSSDLPEGSGSDVLVEPYVFIPDTQHNDELEQGLHSGYVVG